MQERMDAEYDFEDKRLQVVNSFSILNVRFLGNARCEAVVGTAASQGVSKDFVWKHTLDAEANEGFFSPSMWGKNPKTPWKLADMDIQRQALEYCRENNGHRRDRPNLTAPRFAKWLQDTFNIDVTSDQAGVYLHRLGGTWQSVKKGSYVDAHEEPYALRHEAEFLTAYAQAYSQGPNFIKDEDKDLCSDVEEWAIDEMKHPRGFGLGGQLHSTHNGRIAIIVCDDEVCCFASERELYCWSFAGCTNGHTPAKNKGSARHLAGLMMEVGNGRLSMDYDKPPQQGGITELKKLEEFNEALEKGLDPVIPRHADVGMRPGKAHEGYWLGKHKCMQMHLLGSIFNVVFNTSLDLSCDIRVSELEAALEATRAANDGQLPYEMVLQLDRSQQHLMARDGGLNAKKMRKGRGYEDANPHIRSSVWPRQPVDIRQENCRADGSCEKCKAELAEYKEKHGNSDDFQAIGWKGLAMLASERGTPNAAAFNVEQLVEIVEAYEDFRDEVSAVEAVLNSHGHRAIIGAECHSVSPPAHLLFVTCLILTCDLAGVSIH